MGQTTTRSSESMTRPAAATPKRHPPPEDTRTENRHRQCARARVVLGPPPAALTRATCGAVQHPVPQFSCGLTWVFRLLVFPRWLSWQWRIGHGHPPGGRVLLFVSNFRSALSTCTKRRGHLHTNHTKPRPAGFGGPTPRRGALKARGASATGACPAVPNAQSSGAKAEYWRHFR